MKRLEITLLLGLALACSTHVLAEDTSDEPFVRMTAEELRDKIRGGLLGQILGNLNGLQHEMKYIDQPGNVTTYTPALPEGARTDDDTDFEWVYIVEMQRRGEIYLSPEQISELWRSRINRRIWCSNQFARQLMDLRLKPPLTGRSALNPWAEFNISGQFLCESFGLLAPAMPQTAARIGLIYTTVAIDLEPAQTTQLFTTMIATAFVEGYRWMLSQEWQIVDRYRNTTREEMPNDETITSFADRLCDLAEQVILDNSGRREFNNGMPVYYIQAESPRCVSPLPNLEEQVADMRKTHAAEIEDGILHGSNPQTTARAAYLAICLDMDESFQKEHPEQWQRALSALGEFDNVVQAIYHHADVPAGEPLRQRASAAGLQKPENKKRLW